MCGICFSLWIIYSEMQAGLVGGMNGRGSLHSWYTYPGHHRGTAVISVAVAVARCAVIGATAAMAVVALRPTLHVR